MENSAARTYSKLSTLGVCVHIYIHTQNTVGKYKAKWGTQFAAQNKYKAKWGTQFAAQNKYKAKWGTQFAAQNKYKAKWGAHRGELKLRETRTAQVKVF
jgi:hypothetical protein